MNGPPPDILGQILWQIGFSICQQRPERSFFIDGYQLPMDARETGTFIGFLVLMIYGFLMKKYRCSKLPDKYIMFLAISGFVIYAFDGASSYLGLRDTTNEMRLISGLLMGSGVGFFIMPVISVVLLNLRTETKSFTWKDLPFVYGLLAFVGLAVYYIRSGLVFYYLFALLIIIGYLLWFFIMLNILVALLTNKNYLNKKDSLILIITTIIVQIFVHTLMWVGHQWTNAALLG